MAHVISDECVSCGSCEGECPVGAISEGDGKYEIDADLSRVIIKNRKVITSRRDTVSGESPTTVSLF